jgi:predicted enzyme related to lactoylglutathione lyase
MAGKQGSFVWYELMSTDVAAAKAFYGKVVGWATQDMPMPGMTYTLLLAEAKQVGGMMSIPKDALAAGMRPFWGCYIDVSDCDAAASKVQRLGGKVHAPPTDIPNIGRFAMVADPQGAVFNVFKPQPSPQQSGERGVSNAPGQVGWHELHAQDGATAFDFYSEMFGWRKGESHDMGPMGTYQLFTINDIPSGGMFNSPAAASARFWLIYFSVPAIDAAAKRLTDAGGKITNGPVQVPGGLWVVQGTDPQGASFGLLSQTK